jgi:biopolymer transport protein ExbD
MLAERRAVRRRPVTLTPLIDVIFLLLLFFMLSSTFTRFAELPLSAAGSGAGVAEAPPLFLRISPDGLSLNGAAQTLETLPGALGRIAGRDGDAPATILVAVAEGTSSQRLVDLLVVLRSEPRLSVRVLE